MIRRQLIVAIAILAIACVSPALAGGTRARGKGKPKPSTATTRTIVNSTSKSWYTYVYSGTGGMANTVSAANAQGAKVIAPGGKGVFNVLPNAGGNQFGDYVVVISVPPLDVNNPNAGIGSQEGWPIGTFNNSDYPGLKAGENFTITITQSSPDAFVEFNPPAP